MLNMRSILHNGIVESFFMTSCSASGKRLIPVSLGAVAENPAAKIFTLENEYTLCADHYYINF